MELGVVVDLEEDLEDLDYQDRTWDQDHEETRVLVRRQASFQRLSIFRRREG